MSARLPEGSERPGVSLDGVKVTLVLPCLNEERAVGACVRMAIDVFEASGLDGYVLVVDNGSTDGSVVAAREAGARVVRQTEPGYGAAIRSGIEVADTEYVVMADADGTYELEAMPRLLAPLVADEADLVLGSRLDDATAKTMPWLHHHVGTPLITRLVNRAGGNKIKIHDSQSGFRAFRRTQMLDLALTATGMEFATEMLIRSSWARLRIIDVQTRYSQRIGESKLETFSDGLRHLRQILLLSPDAFATDPGIIMTCASFVLWIVACFSQQRLGAVGSMDWVLVQLATVLGVIGPITYCAGLVIKYRAETLGLRHSPPKRPILSLVWRFFFFGVALMILAFALVILLVVNFHKSLFSSYALERVLGSIAICSGIVGVVLACMPLLSPFLLQGPTRQLPRAEEEFDVLPGT